MMGSIRLTLLKWLIVPLLSVDLIGAGLTYWLAWEPARIAFDQGLADSAWALIPRLKMRGNDVEVDLPNPAEQILRVDHFDEIFFVVRNASGKTIVGDHDFPALQRPASLNEPLAYDAAMRGEPVRVISLRTTVGDKEIAIGVAETLRKRQQSRSEIIISLLALEGILIVIFIAIIWAAVGKGLRPMRRMQGELNARQLGDLSPMSQRDMPAELVPVVKGINDLLGRLDAGARAQQDFLADVAHQLRTPLAGLRTHLEWLQQRYANDADTAHSAELMLSAVERLTRKSNQLLALARAEPSRYQPEKLETVYLDKLVEESIEHFVHEADKKDIDLGFDLRPTAVTGDRFLLRDLIDNLIDNAIRYTPRNGRVTVSCRQESEGGILIVEDNGPGIPQSAKDLVFTRFYRLGGHAEGSGLGLAIVRDIAEDHAAHIDIRPGAGAVGTAFSVRFRMPRFASA